MKTGGEKPFYEKEFLPVPLFPKEHGMPQNSVLRHY